MKASRFALTALWVTGAAIALGVALASATFALAAANPSPPAPTLVSPSNGTATTTAAQQSASWDAVTDAAGGITYVYQSANASSTNPDGSFTTPLYTSAPTASTTISTAGTPEGTYYWHVQATDANGNTSPWSDAWSFTIENPPAAPVISSVAVSPVASTSATVTWTTDQPSTSQVSYGTSAAYSASTTEDTTDVTSHSVMLSDLAAGTTYHFSVESTDAGGAATSSDQTFTTSAASTSPAVISDIAVSSIGTSTASVSWTTDQAADSQISYGTTTAYGTTASSTADVTSHSLALSDLAAGTTYHFMVQSDNSNGTATSSDQTFVTESASTGTSTPLALNGITDNQSTATADGTYADGWEWTFQFSVPMDETQLALSFSNFINDTDSSSTIAAANDMQYWSADSSNATSSASAIDITAANTYPTTMLNLTGNEGTSTGDRTVNVVVQMAIPVGTASGSYTANWSAESTTTASSTNQ